MGIAPVVDVVIMSGPLGMLGFFTFSDKATAWTLNLYITFGRRSVTLSLDRVEMKVSASSGSSNSGVAETMYLAIPGCPISEGRSQQRTTQVAPKSSTVKFRGTPGATVQTRKRAAGQVQLT